MKKLLYSLLISLAIILISFRFLCGIFVIQPIGAIPEGITIVYWRYDLNLPFISSVDGILQDTEGGVSLFSRGIMLGELSEPILEREIFRTNYSEYFYLKSTGGITYEK
jgi:hypothetical protein